MGACEVPVAPEVDNIIEDCDPDQKNSSDFKIVSRPESARTFLSTATRTVFPVVPSGCCLNLNFFPVYLQRKRAQEKLKMHIRKFFLYFICSVYPEACPAGGSKRNHGMHEPPRRRLFQAVTPVARDAGDKPYP